MQRMKMERLFLHQLFPSKGVGFTQKSLLS
jgi:hypothetical protein